MGKVVGHRWICDGCLDESSHKGGDMPKGWAQFSVTVRNGLACGIQPWVCETCFAVLFQNRKKGPTWLRRLRACLSPKITQETK